MDLPDNESEKPLEDVSYVPDPPAEEVEVVEGEVVSTDFETRVQRLLDMMESDPRVRDRMLCEMYIGFSDMDKAMRTVALNGGPLKMLKAMMGKGGE